MLTPAGRALTDEQKRAVMERLLAAWQKRPALRLGQMLEAANGIGNLFYREDEDLVQDVERLVEER